MLQESAARQCSQCIFQCTCTDASAPAGSAPNPSASIVLRRLATCAGVYVTVKARSGAHIIQPKDPSGSDSWPPEAAELPADIPDISHQLGAILSQGTQQPLSTIKLVLMNGCANDVDPAFPFLCRLCKTVADVDCAANERCALRPLRASPGCD